MSVESYYTELKINEERGIAFKEARDIFNNLIKSCKESQLPSSKYSSGPIEFKGGPYDCMSDREQFGKYLDAISQLNGNVDSLIKPYNKWSNEHCIGRGCPYSWRMPPLQIECSYYK